MVKSGKKATKAWSSYHMKYTVLFIEDEQVYQVTCAGRVNKYGIGSVVPKGSCAYKEERGEWTAKTLDDAKQMAEDFASNMLALK